MVLTAALLIIAVLPQVGKAVVKSQRLFTEVEIDKI